MKKDEDNKNEKEEDAEAVPLRKRHRRCVPVRRGKRDLVSAFFCRCLDELLTRPVSPEFLIPRITDRVGNDSKISFSLLTTLWQVVWSTNWRRTGRRETMNLKQKS